MGVLSAVDKIYFVAYRSHIHDILSIARSEGFSGRRIR